MGTMKVNNKSNQGFTIVEVLIVLTIAGLLLSIIFLAVPALQRNQRNTARRSDASSILSALTEWTSNNSGKLPTTCTAGAASGNCGDNTASSTSTWLKAASLGQIPSSAVSFTNNTSAPTSLPTNTVLDSAVVHSFLKCSGNSATTTGASYRSYVVLYSTETPTGSSQQCMEG